MSSTVATRRTSRALRLTEVHAPTNVHFSDEPGPDLPSQVCSEGLEHVDDPAAKLRNVRLL